MLLALGCDEEQANPIQKGQSYVDQARGVSAGADEQSIALARGMIQAGKLADAERLLDEVGQHSLSPKTQESLDAARKELADAK